MTTSTAGLAKLVGTNGKGGRIWAVDGKLLDDAQFDALIASQAVHTDAEALIDRELGESLSGLDLQRAAEERLRARGVQPDEASQAQLLDALVAVAP